MKNDLFPYYERELQFFTEMAKEFGRDHPKQAGRLAMEGGKSTDPHVERLIQAFSLIAGRIRHKLDDEFPEITEALLNILYPHYTRPIPSMAIAQFQVDPSQSRAVEGYHVPHATPLLTRTVAGMGVPCRFRTAYSSTVWPLRIVSAQIVPPASLHAVGQIEDITTALRLVVEGLGGAKVGAMKLKTLRFYLQGDGEIPYLLYELLLNSVRQVHLAADQNEDTVPYRFPKNAIRAVGFEGDEGLLPIPPTSFAGYRLMSEFFSFPEKFLFFDLAGFETAPLHNLGSRFELTFLIGEFERKDRLRTLERLLRPENFQLGCTPIVNLFGRPADPIRVSHTKTEYRVIPDLHSPKSAEVYSIDAVTSVASYTEGSREYRPFYGLQHNYDGETPTAFWFATRRPSKTKDDKGTEVYLSLVDMDFRPANPPTESLSVGITCTNRDLPAQLPLTGEFGDLSLEGAAGIKVRCLAKPTESIRPPLHSSLQWRLISHLALNYVSLADTSTHALREILALYNYGDNPVARNQIAGISSVSSKPHMARIITEAGVAFALGLSIQMEFDEDRYVGNGAFLFASVLERFLGLYCSVNSFTQLTARTRQRKGILRTWLPRAGNQILV